MAELSAELATSLVEHLNAQSAVLAESFNQCFNLSLVVNAGTSGAWDASSDAALQEPGVACLFQVGEVGAAVVIPASLRLPDWYRQPNDSEKSRLDTLAMEWGMNLFPLEFEAARTSSVAVDNLATFVTGCQPSANAAVIRLPLTDGDLTELGGLTLIWPLGQLNWNPPKLFAAEPPPQPTALPAVPASHTHQGSASKPSRIDPLARLRKLPVTVSVRLTERRISMSQLLAITPGALLTFNKSCDDLLDLYVNNALYCRGEAVKIGESFGLKINEVGVRVERESKILDS